MVNKSNMQKYRFCPSPTGTLHIGSARTALFNYLLARNSKAKFVLRIEDTDLKRSKLEYEVNIMQGLDWLGIEWDEFYRQSERKEIYQEFANHLLITDKAYEEDGAIKFRVVKEKVTFHDLIRGEITIDMELQEDFVIIKSDGSAGFHWANVVDDFDMGISHVIRGEDHISNTPKQIQLYNAMDWELPSFGHLSIILAPDKSKLSKRNGAKSIDQLEAEGFLPKAVFNYLSTLGWSHPDDKEILTKREIVDAYTIDRVSKSNSVFDSIKMGWMNKEYIKKLSDYELAKFIPGHDQRLAELIRDRIVSLADIDALVAFTKFPKWDEIAPNWVSLLHDMINLDFDVNYKEAVDFIISDCHISKDRVYAQFRYGITGEHSGLPIFKIAEYLGQKEIVKRLKSYLTQE